MKFNPAGKIIKGPGGKDIKSSITIYTPAKLSLEVRLMAEINNIWHLHIMKVFKHFIFSYYSLFIHFFIYSFIHPFIHSFVLNPQGKHIGH